MLFLLGCQNLSIDVTPRTELPTLPQTWLTQLGLVTKAFPGGSSSAYDVCLGTAVDTSGNVYCAGSTNSNLGETNAGNGDAFIMKLNSAGAVQWVTHLGVETAASSVHVIDTTRSDYCSSVAVDSSGNVYCGGTTYGDLGETKGGDADAFVVKLNSAGVVQWVSQIGTDTQTAIADVVDTSGGDFCNGVTVDNTGNVFCAGYTNGGLGETAGGLSDPFIVKLNSSGVVQWLRHVGDDTETASAFVNDSSGSETCSSVAIDGAGNVYCAGSTNGALGEASGGDSDAFAMKLDASGNVVWLSQMGSATEVASAHVDDTSGFELFDGITVDNAGNVYCGGATRGSFTETNVSGGGGYDALVVKLDSTGTVVWASQLGNETAIASSQLISSAGWDVCNNVAIDSSGNVYCSGDAGNNLAEAAGAWAWDPMVIKLNSAGTLQWVRQLGSVTLSDPAYQGGSAYGVAVDANGSVYIGGEIYGTAGEAEGGAGTGDLFVAKFKSDGTLEL